MSLVSTYQFIFLIACLINIKFLQFKVSKKYTNLTNNSTLGPYISTLIYLFHAKKKKKKKTNLRKRGTIIIQDHSFNLNEPHISI